MELNRIFNVKIVDAQSMGGSITSTPYDISEAIGYSVQAVWTGTSPVGNFILQGSNNGVNFTDITSAGVSGNSGSLLINVEICRYASMRVVYSSTSGTGTLNVNLNGVGN